MRVLVACEFSGAVRDAFRARGHDALSCDLLPTEVEGPHHQGNVLDLLVPHSFDLIIAHPPCTALAVSGNRWYGKGMPRHADRLEAIEWTTALWRKACEAAPLVAMENPVSVIFQHIQAAVQYIQPWQFGHGETKRTGIALAGLMPLRPTDVVDGREARVHRMPPGPDRWKERSRTFPGVAAAMADQWGCA